MRVLIAATVAAAILSALFLFDRADLEAQFASLLPGMAVHTRPSANSPTAGGSDAGETQSRSGEVEARTRPVTVSSARSGSLPIIRQTIGTIVPIVSTALGSPEAGIVAKVLVEDGLQVKAGDLLVQLDDRTIKADIRRDQALLAKDQANLDEANATLKRVENLNRSGVDTQQQYGDAVSAAKQAAAAVDVDNANLAADNVILSNTQIRAPFDGKLGAVLVSPGAYLAAGADVVVLTQMKPVFAEFALAEPDLDVARAALANRRLTVEAAPTLSEGDNRTAKGDVIFIDNAVDAASGTFRLRARLANENEAFWPGQALDITVTAGTRDGVVVVPSDAVLPHGDGFISYVVRPDRTIEVRNVVPALSVGDRTGIAEGLQDGEQVVTEGQAGLVEGSRVTIDAT
jgi:membrane fusion protein, multidrug efflux system